MKMKSIDAVATIIAVIGALLWGLYGLAGMNPIGMVLGNSIAATIVYAIIAFAGILVISFKFGSS